MGENLIPYPVMMIMKVIKGGWIISNKRSYLGLIYASVNAPSTFFKPVYIGFIVLQVYILQRSKFN